MLILGSSDFIETVLSFNLIHIVRTLEIMTEVKPQSKLISDNNTSWDNQCPDNYPFGNVSTLLPSTIAQHYSSLESHT